MKKLIISLLAAVLAVALYAASLPADNRTVLSTTTDSGVTTTLYVGRVQTDPAADGSCVLTVFPDKVITLNGNVLAHGFDQSFNVALTAQQYAGIAAIIKTAYTAQHPSP